MWMRTGFGVRDLSRFFFVDLDLERLREWIDRDCDGSSDFLFTLSFNGFSFELRTRPSLLDDDEELELEDDDELEEDDRDEEDELSEELFLTNHISSSFFISKI